MPRIVRWLLFNFLLMTLFMFLLRWAITHFFPEGASSSNNLWNAYWLGFRFDWRMIAMPSIITLIFGFIKPIHPFETKAGMRISLFIWFLAVTVMILFYAFDFAHFAYLKQRLNASALNYTADAKISFSMVWQSYPIVRSLLGVLAATFIICWLLKKLYNVCVYIKPVAKAKRIGWNAAAFVLLALAIFGRVGQYPLRWSDAFSLGSDYKANLALNPMQSFFSSLSFRSATFDEAKVKEAYPSMAAYLGATPNVNELNFNRNYAAQTDSTNRTKPNVVLVICESFSFYKSSMSDNPTNTTPFFNEMCKQGIFFNRCFTPSYGTARGVWATITGLPDVSPTSTASRNPSMVNQHSIINDFTGYEKFYFIGGSASWANIRGLLENNIDSLHLYEQDSYKAAKVDVWGISDKNLFIESNKILATQKKPFFAVIQTADNHRPYTIPTEDLTTFKKLSYPKDSLLKYGFENEDEFNAFRYTDFCYQQFITSAQKEAYFDNTIFVFVGDHGIPGNANGVLPNVFTDEKLTSMHVPLLIYAPKLLQPAKHDFNVSQMDVLPTIAGLCHINYRNNALGRNVLEKQKDSTNANVSFMYDPDQKIISMIQNNQLFKLYLNDQKEVFKSLTNQPVDEKQKDAYRKRVNDFYETARYLLLHNKK
jgi:phosphoglycerol transferase MdoB-like AlkP superfamily enzyme